MSRFLSSIEGYEANPTLLHGRHSLHDTQACRQHRYRERELVSQSVQPVWEVNGCHTAIGNPSLLSSDLIYHAPKCLL